MPGRMFENRRELIFFIARIAVPVVIFVIFLRYIVCITTVASGSMEPKLKVGNMAAYNRLAYKKHEPERGDIVIFWSDEMNEHMAKRIIGIPGDEIKFIDGYVFINGQRADESEYIEESIETNCAEIFTVPENSVFVMGDNREYSFDSRFFDQPYINYKDIEGKYIGQSTFNPKWIIESRFIKK